MSYPSPSGLAVGALGPVGKHAAVLCKREGVEGRMNAYSTSFTLSSPSCKMEKDDVRVLEYASFGPLHRPSCKAQPSEITGNSKRRNKQLHV